MTARYAHVIDMAKRNPALAIPVQGCAPSNANRPVGEDTPRPL
jgi:hypothetical protein